MKTLTEFNVFRSCLNKTLLEEASSLTALHTHIISRRLNSILQQNSEFGGTAEENPARVDEVKCPRFQTRSSAANCQQMGDSPLEAFLDRQKKVEFRLQPEPSAAPNTKPFLRLLFLLLPLPYSHTPSPPPPPSSTPQRLSVLGGTFRKYGSDF